jgi:hypothetical protein
MTLRHWGGGGGRVGANKYWPLSSVGGGGRDMIKGKRRKGKNGEGKER